MSPYFNERDIEIPGLLNFVDVHSKEITTILDVGCYGSLYFKELEERDKIVDGIDLKFGELGESHLKFLRNYFVGNVIAYPLKQYDLVICLSTIEHVGLMEQYEVDDFVQEQNLFFKRLIDVSRRFIYATFPYGAPHKPVLQSANITRNSLDGFFEVIPNMAFCKMRFYFNDCPSSSRDWTEITQNEADKVKWDRDKGCRCVCTLEVTLNESISDWRDRVYW